MYYSINFSLDDVTYETVVKADNKEKASEILVEYWKKRFGYIKINNIVEYHLLTNEDI